LNNAKVVQAASVDEAMGMTKAECDKTKDSVGERRNRAIHCSQVLVLQDKLAERVQWKGGYQQISPLDVNYGPPTWLR
jgi:hypothetical protein